MLMALDQFIFSLVTAPFHELQRQRGWKHRTSPRVGARDASQFVGAGDDTITLAGLVAPQTIGSASSLSRLATMADVGDAYVLLDGLGHVYGAYVIETLQETQTHHSQEGIARRIDFTMTLKRVDDRALTERDD